MSSKKYVKQTVASKDMPLLGVVIAVVPIAYIFSMGSHTVPHRFQNARP
jgi:hypothetical protein